MSSAKICPYLAFFQSIVRANCSLHFFLALGWCVPGTFSLHTRIKTPVLPMGVSLISSHAKQFFFVMFQVKNWLHATPKDVTEPRSSLATTVSRFIRGPLCTFWAVQELNQECQLLWTCTHCCFLLL